MVANMIIISYPAMRAHSELPECAQDLWVHRTRVKMQRALTSAAEKIATSEKYLAYEFFYLSSSCVSIGRIHSKFILDHQVL